MAGSARHYILGGGWNDPSYRFKESDAQSAWTRGAAFGLRFSLPADLTDLYRSFKIDLAAFNDDPSWTLSMPARYVIGRDGTILYAEVNPDYTRRPEPEDVLGVLETAAA